MENLKHFNVTEEMMMMMMTTGERLRFWPWMCVVFFVFFGYFKGGDGNPQPLLEYCELFCLVFYKMGKEIRIQ